MVPGHDGTYASPYPVHTEDPHFAYAYPSPPVHPAVESVQPMRINTASSELASALGDSPIWGASLVERTPSTTQPAYSTASPYYGYPSTPELVLSSLDDSAQTSSSSSPSPSSDSSSSPSISPTASQFNSDLFAPPPPFDFQPIVRISSGSSSTSQGALPPSSFNASLPSATTQKTHGYHPYRPSSSQPTTTPASSPTTKRTDRPRRRTGHSSRKREKHFRCPQPNCTKAYLNPNGLKYHLEKGTCTFEEGAAGAGVREEEEQAPELNEVEPELVV